jgi:rubrerythrin
MASMSGTQTEKNLMAAFAGECQAAARYSYFAKKARKEGFEKIAVVFERTSEEEQSHASVYYKFLPGPDCKVEAVYGVPGNKSTQENLVAGAAGEHEEWSALYPRFAEIAREEGFNNVAKAFASIAMIERHHESRYSKLAGHLADGTLFKRAAPVVWRCLKCGHLHEGLEAPAVCPACAHVQGYFEVFSEGI